MHTQSSTNFLSLFLSLPHTHTRAHTLSPSRFALLVSISCHLKSRTAGASGSRRGARLTGNGPHSLIRLPCSCPSSATPRMSSPGGRRRTGRGGWLVECEAGGGEVGRERERERESEREREKESEGGGVSSQIHLKELDFSDSGEREAEELSGAASLKKGEQGPGEPR